MKAIVCTRPGPADGLELRDVELPSPRENEVLVQVHAATVTIGDVILRRLPPLVTIPLALFGLKWKRIPGHELAGVIEAVGAKVSRYRPGDRVFGTTTGLAVGANAEYVCLPESWKAGALAIAPAGMSHVEAAAVPVGGMTALRVLRRGGVRQGQRILVYGASGSVGSYAVQIARARGAVVTGVCSAANGELVKSLGADEVIDYTREDYTLRGPIHDVVLDAVGRTSRARARGALKPGGIYLSVRSPAAPSPEDLVLLRDLIEEGRVRAVIDRCYPLERAAEAHRYVEAGHKKGNVVINVRQESP